MARKRPPPRKRAAKKTEKRGKKKKKTRKRVVERVPSSGQAGESAKRGAHKDPNRREFQYWIWRDKGTPRCPTHASVMLDEAWRQVQQRYV
jgi:hypothetical protein